MGVVIIYLREVEFFCDICLSVKEGNFFKRKDGRNLGMYGCGDFL